MLILVCMLMRCLRNSGFDRRYMAEAALAMRDVMSREDEPSFVIKDPRYMWRNRQTVLPCCISSMADGWCDWGVIAMSLVFGQLFCIPTRLASSWSIIRASWSTHTDGGAGIHRAVSRGYNDSTADGARRIRWSITQFERSGAMTQPCFTPVSMVNSSDREEARRTALRVSVYNWRTRTESSCGTPQIWRIFHKESRDTESKAAL